MSLSKLLMMSSQAASAPVEPSTVSFTASQFASGFTGPTNTTKNASRIYMIGQLTLWSGWITGSEAKWTMTSEYGDYDGAVQVAVNGSAFSNASRAGQVFTLFTGLPHGAQFVEIRVAAGLGDVAYMASTGNVLAVTGAPPGLLTLANKVQVGGNSQTGLYSGMTVPGGAGFTPSLQVAKGTTYGSNVGSVRIKGSFNKLVVSVNGNRHVGVSKNGAPPTVYSKTDEIDHPTTAMVIPLDGSLATYNIWDDGNEHSGGGVFAVAGDSEFLNAGTVGRMDQYGDSVTMGSGPGATSVDTETMAVAAALGYVGSTNGISGLTITGGKGLVDLVLPSRTVSSSDVAILALGGNSASNGIDTTEQSDYNYIIDALLTKGYGTVLCRGIIPLADSGAASAIDAANAVLESLVTARNNPQVKWVDTSAWVGYETQDGVHPTTAGYVTLAGYAQASYQALL